MFWNKLKIDLCKFGGKKMRKNRKLFTVAIFLITLYNKGNKFIDLNAEFKNNYLYSKLM